MNSKTLFISLLLILCTTIIDGKTTDQGTFNLPLFESEPATESEFESMPRPIIPSEPVDRTDESNESQDTEDLADKAPEKQLPSNNQQDNEQKKEKKLVHKPQKPQGIPFQNPSSDGLTVEERLKTTDLTDPDLFKNNTVVAYYGHPNSKVMGIVGRYSKSGLAQHLLKTANTYDRVNGERGVIPAFYIIYGICHPKGEIGRLRKEKLLSYIQFALEHNFIIYIDHQIGKYKPSQALAEMLPYLKYPNVHLAIDVEWRTTRPMKEIGHITAAELNGLQKQMRDYMLEHNIPGKRQLVFHQFHKVMVRGIRNVNAGYDPVMLIHSTSGWGNPAVKRSTHKRNAKITNIPNKGFKLWYYYSDKKGIHYDKPLMSPAQVLKLNPQPGLVIYQ